MIKSSRTDCAVCIC